MKIVQYLMLIVNAENVAVINLLLKAYYAFNAYPCKSMILN